MKEFKKGEEVYIKAECVSCASDGDTVVEYLCYDHILRQCSPCNLVIFHKEDSMFLDNTKKCKCCYYNNDKRSKYCCMCGSPLRLKTEVTSADLLRAYSELKNIDIEDIEVEG